MRYTILIISIICASLLANPVTAQDDDSDSPSNLLERLIALFTLEAAAPDCPGALTPRLRVGDSARQISTESVRPRDYPMGAPLEVFIEPGATVTVTDGPICFEDSYWWQIDTSTFTVWIPESDPDDGYLFELE